MQGCTQSGHGLLRRSMQGVFSEACWIQCVRSEVHRIFGAVPLPARFSLEPAEVVVLWLVVENVGLQFALVTPPLEDSNDRLLRRQYASGPLLVDAKRSVSPRLTTKTC